MLALNSQPQNVLGVTKSYTGSGVVKRKLPSNPGSRNRTQGFVSFIDLCEGKRRMMAVGDSAWTRGGAVYDRQVLSLAVWPQTRQRTSLLLSPHVQTKMTTSTSNGSTRDTVRDVSTGGQIQNCLLSRRSQGSALAWAKET